MAFGDQVCSYSLCGFWRRITQGVCSCGLPTGGDTFRTICQNCSFKNPSCFSQDTDDSQVGVTLSITISKTDEQALGSEVPLTEPHCFSDSTVAIYWIRGVEKTWKPFVQNRVMEIRRLMQPPCWFHCPGQHNPADIPSRGHTPQQLLESSLWRSGPEWLKSSKLNEAEPLELPMPEDCQIEMKTDKAETAHGLQTMAEPPGIGQLMACENFSSLSRLVSITAKVVKFCHLLLSKIRPEAIDTNLDHHMPRLSICG